jgi:hypothetical protein
VTGVASTGQTELRGYPSGRPAKADATYLAALAQAGETTPRGVGQPFDVWTSGRLSAYLAETTRIRIAPGWGRVLLHREGFATGRPNPAVAHLHDPAEVVACADRLREAGGKRGPRIRRGTNCPSRMRRTSRRIRILGASGTGWASNRSCRQPASDGLRQRRGEGARSGRGRGRPRTRPGSRPPWRPSPPGMRRPNAR